MAHIRYNEQKIEVFTSAAKSGVETNSTIQNDSADELDESQTHVKTLFSPYSDRNEPDSQIPNQEFYIILYNALNDKPKELYISKLTELCHSDANLIGWYRSVLASRAQAISTCPNGILKARRKTAKSSVEHKLATDCHILRMFIEGENSNEIETVLNKYRAESCTAEINEVELPEKTTSEVLDLAELFSSVHVLQSQVTTLTEARADDLEHINNLQIEIKKPSKKK